MNTTSLIPKMLATGTILLLANIAQAGQGPQPSICTRSCWGARNGTCTTTISTLNRAIIHHTASSTDYNTTSQATTAANVRSTQNYHMDSRGWCDIGYHFLADKLGNLFEGRKNSMTGLPKGTHDGNNGNSFGFNLMGYYHSPYNNAPTSVSRAKLYDVIAWRMPSAWSPYGSGSYNGNTVGYLDGHLKVKATACPGETFYPPYITANYSGGEARNEVNNRKNGTPPPPPPTTFWKKWKAGAISHNLDGRMQSFAVGTSSKLYSSGQTAINQGTWSAWQDLGGLWSATNWPTHPVVAHNQDGRMQIFLVGNSGELFTSGQVANNQGTWSGWQSMGGSWTGKTPAVGYNQDGRMQVFLVGATGALFTSGQVSNNQGTWSAWQSLGGAWPADKIPAVSHNADGRMQVFIIGSTGKLYTSGQVSNNQGTWSGWQDMGGVWPGKVPVVANNLDGRMQVFLVGTTGALFTSGQTANNQGTWSGWQDLGGVWNGKTPALGYNNDGRMQIFLVGTTGALFTSGQVSNNQGTWSAWQSFGGIWPTDPFVSRNQDGRMQVFCIGQSHEMFTSGQVSNNQGTWSAWQNLGGWWPAF